MLIEITSFKLNPCSRQTLPFSQTQNIIQRNYFDDVSRFSSVDWVDDDLMRRVDAKASADKMEAMKRFLGYDAVSASQISKKGVKKLLKTWSRKSGAVGRLQGDELFNKLVGIKVCRYNDMLGCLAYYWSTIVKVIREEDEKEGVYMICFPYCKDLYTYDTLNMLNEAIDMGRDLCMHLGSDFSLTMFHPKYKNAPSLFSPERHSPFPTGGLKFSGKKKEMDLPVDDSKFLDNQRIGLEHLFNSAAASSPSDEIVFEDESQVPFYPAEEVVEYTQKWFITGEQPPSAAFQYAHTADNRWFVSKATIAEEAYADIWAVIHQLNQLGLENEGVVVSSVLIAPRFSSFNAPQWRQFAITVNAVLKRVTNGKMYLEVFHPEYTGSKDASNDLRRSPFPTIQVCYKA